MILLALVILFFILLAILPVGLENIFSAKDLAEMGVCFDRSR